MARSHISGELAGSTSAAQMPARTCAMVRFKAAADNAGNVYIGIAGVTKPDGSTDTTTGFPLDAGDDTGWMPCNGLDDFYYITDNAGDEVVYLGYV